MNTQKVRNDAQVLVYEECRNNLDGLLCRVRHGIESIKRAHRINAAFHELRRLSPRQLSDTGLQDPRQQIAIFGRPIDLGSLDRDISRYALFGDACGRL